MLTANDRLRKQAKRVSKEVHKMNGTVKEAAQEKLRQIRKDGSKRYEEGRGKMRRAERGVVMIYPRPTPEIDIDRAGRRVRVCGCLVSSLGKGAGSYKQCRLKLLMLLEPISKENFHAFHNLDRRFDFSAAGSAAHLEPQQGMGLFSQRRARIGCADPPRPRSHARHLIASADNVKENCKRSVAVDRGLLNRQQRKSCFEPMNHIATRRCVSSNNRR